MRSGSLKGPTIQFHDPETVYGSGGDLGIGSLNECDIVIGTFCLRNLFVGALVQEHDRLSGIKSHEGWLRGRGRS